MNYTFRLLTIFFILTFISCEQLRQERDAEDGQEPPTISLDDLEKYRPVFHFTPAENWTNDPNGLVHYNGEYHLFYQYNPYGIQWGHMSWGHAVSNDLVEWVHQPVAIYEEDDEMIFSGSAVVDYNNTSGLCKGEDCLIAIYTSHVEDEAQYQSIGYSNDQGRTWQKYESNPVLDINKKDFRDPKVFWFEPEEKWVMVVSVPLEHKVQFYESDNIIDWDLTGEFGNQGDTSMIWECPDLVQVPVEGQDTRKWVLIISSGSQYDSFTGMQYFIGNFDGNKFTAEGSTEKPNWLDFGKDFYAAITYNNLPPGLNPVLVGWVNNWRYANSIPTSPWRGMMSIPRELTLREVNGEWRLIQNPVTSVYNYVTQFEKVVHEDHAITADDPLLNDISSGSYRLIMELENHSAGEFGVEVLRGGSERTVVGYKVDDEQLFINRKESGNIRFHDDFPSIEYAPLSLEDNKLKLDIIVDQSVVEVFAEDGYRVITDQVFPENEEKGLKLYAEGGEVMVTSLELYIVK